METTKKNVFKTFFLVGICLAGIQVMTNAQENKSKIPSYLSVGGWFDNQYTYENQQNNDGSYTEVNTFHTRRARLDIKGNITEQLEFRLQTDVSGTPKLIDAFIKYKFNKMVNIELGQFKTPFTLENQYSPLNQEGIDNSLVINNLAGFSDILGGNRNAGRDIGIMLYGDILNSSDGGYALLSYNIGVFNGSGIDRKDDNLSKDVIGRLDFHPFIRELVLSASAVKGTYNDGTDKIAGNNRFAFGGEYKDDALVVRSEYVRADYENNGTWLKADGFYVVAGYWFKVGKEQKLRPVVRFDQFNQNNLTSNLYMVGIDWWPESHLRLQLNYTMRDREQFDRKGDVITAMASIKF